MTIRWKLRMVAAQREVWTGAELQRLLRERAGVEMSLPSVWALLTKQPKQVKLETLAALCQALDCTPDELFEIAAVTVTAASPSAERTRKQAAAAPAKKRSLPPA
jgi:DNA-binding Xre family transcriptional regulator